MSVSRGTKLDALTLHLRGVVLSALGRYKEAITSHSKSLELKPDFSEAWYYKACWYGLQGEVDLAIENLRHSISLDPRFLDRAKENPFFTSIRQDDRFQALIADSDSE